MIRECGQLLNACSTAGSLTLIEPNKLELDNGVQISAKTVVDFFGVADSDYLSALQFYRLREVRQEMAYYEFAAQVPGNCERCVFGVLRHLEDSQRQNADEKTVTQETLARTYAWLVREVLDDNSALIPRVQN
jgi:hypothetical protein